ncbi:alpha/beta fold hydrolase [Roseibium sediminicola]|uniref:Alpha/beta hydrolase n=1 Tax=Roseibium sediminicola TaxID=2933272 RepID=A0ABT0H211_9HYPH|nr:alpha/beta hydrolase [Roseibium sp. CAU 1639]MCK7615727.1 alpha/beta hydrolase [Roseibium sp. CAU 1639]
MPMTQNDVPIYFTSLGEGDPILFCHGAGGNASIWWKQFEFFSPDYQCISFDHRGFGRSRCIREDFSLVEYGKDAISVLDALNIESAHIVCQSMGGWTGMQLAVDHPSRVKSLTLGDTIAGINLSSGVSGMESIIRQIQAVGGSNVALGGRFRKEKPVDAFLYREISAFNTQIRGYDLYGNMFRSEVLKDVAVCKDVACPVLIVSGADDAFWPPKVLKELASYFSAAKFAEIDAGHSPYYETPEEYNRVLKCFLEGIG